MVRIRFVSLLASAFLVACHLTPAQVGGIVRGGISLTCTGTVLFSPPSARGVEAEVCKDAAVLERDLEAVIVESLADASSPTAGPASLGLAAATTAPPAASPAVALTCGGKPIVAITAPPAVVVRAQARLDAKPECAR